MGISPQAIHAQLRKLVQNGEVIRIGAPPKTLYALAETKHSFPELEAGIDQDLAHSFSYLDPTGKLLSGRDAFEAWVSAKKLDNEFVPLAKAFSRTIKDIYGPKPVRPIDTLPRLKSILSSCVLESAHVSDFYALPQFGKTNLGNLIHAIKTAFNPRILETIARSVEEDIISLVKARHIDTIVYVPHSIPRKKQFLPALRRRLQIALPEIMVRKVFYGNIPVAQKSLSKIQERVENAQKTIFIEHYAITAGNVLIIDDAIGSGATINEIARKLLTDIKAKHCHAYAIVGSYKGFDVISTV
jgi:predicted amidophosphoribosyltransferase